jgi:hypothetical protein
MKNVAFALVLSLLPVASVLANEPAAAPADQAAMDEEAKKKEKAAH